jgi:hypothetical protein
MQYSSLGDGGVNAYDAEMNTCCGGITGNYKNVR